MSALRNINCDVSQRPNPLGLSRPSPPAPAGSIDSFAPAHSAFRPSRRCRSFPARSIVDLRKLLAERFPHPPAATTRASLTTGFDLLDRTIGGGLPKSAITELISPRMSAGSASLIHQLLQRAQRDRYFVALIDGRDSFDPQSLDHGSLRHLLWVRCHQAFEVIKATDFLLRDGNFPLVMVDLVLNAADELRKIPQTSWYRLQRLVEATSTVCLVLTRQSLVNSAQLKIVLESSWALQTLEQRSATAGLHFRIQRSHLYPEISSQRSEVG